MTRTSLCRLVCGFVAALIGTGLCSGRAAAAERTPCVSDAERVRAETVAAARSGKVAFQPAPVNLVLYFRNAEDTWLWTPLYMRYADLDASTKWHLVPGLLLSVCTPASFTLITPLYSRRDDDQGSAGFVFNWYWRRDLLEDSDVFFPLVWSNRQRAEIGGETVRGGFSVAPFYFSAWDSNGAHHLFVPPLFWQWGDALQTNTIVGPGYFKATPEGWAGGIFPFYFGGRDRYLAYDLAPAFFHEKDNTGERWFALQTLYSHESNSDDFNLVSFPIVFARHSGDRYYTDVLPLFFHWGDRTETNTIAGPYYGHWTAQGWASGLVPVYFGARGDSRGYDVVPPLLLVREWEPQKSFTMVGSFYLRRDMESWTGGVAPLYFGRRSGPAGYDVMPLFLAAHWWDAEAEHVWALQTLYTLRDDGFSLLSLPLVAAETHGDSHYWLAPPLFAYHEGDGSTETTWAVNTFVQVRPNGFTAFSFPLLYAAREGAEHKTFVLPALTFHWGDGENENTLVANVYYGTETGGWQLRVFPLVWAGRDLLFHYAFVPPLVWNWGSGDDTNTVVANFYVHTDTTGWSAGVVPLYFQGAHGQRAYQFFPPLVWRWFDEGGSTTVYGPYYTHEDGEGWDAGLVPFAFRGRKTDGRFYDVILPPLFWRWGDEEITNAIFLPGYYAHHGPRLDAAVLPFYFWGHDEDSTYDVVPILYSRITTPDHQTLQVANVFYESRPGGNTLDVLPLFYSGRQDDRFYVDVFPLFWLWGDVSGSNTIFGNFYLHEDADTWFAGAVPLYFGGRTRTNGYDVAPPLFFSRWWAEGTNGFYLLNTVYEKDPEGFTFTSFPLVWAGRSEDRFYTNVAPVFFHWGDSSWSKTVALNYYLRLDSDSWDSGLLPAYLGGRRSSGGYDVVPPLLFAHWWDADTTHFLLAQSWYSGSREGWELVSFPLVFAGREGEKHHEFVAPLFWRHGDPSSITTVVGPVYHHEEPAGVAWGIAPLYLRGRWGAAGYDAAPLLLTAHWWDANESRTWFAQTYFASRNDGFTLDSVPFVFANRQGNHSTVLVPPALLYHSEDGAEATTYVANVYHHQQPGSWDFAFFPLVYGGARPDSSYATVLPFFFEKADAESTRATLFPIFHYRHATNDTLFLSPLFVHNAVADYQWTAASPLYFRFRGPDADAQVGFPLYWNFNFKDSGTHLWTVFPVVGQYEKPSETTTWVGNVIWSAGQTERGPSWGFQFAPLVHFESYNPEHLMWSVLEGLVAYEHQGDMYRWRVLYFLTGGNRGAVAEAGAPAGKSTAAAW